jgi:hypothetical protein
VSRKKPVPDLIRNGHLFSEKDALKKRSEAPSSANHFQALLCCNGISVGIAVE